MGLRKWTKEEINILFEKYPKHGSDIPELDRTKSSIAIRASKLKLKVNLEVISKRISKMHTGKKHTKEHRQKISKSRIGYKHSKETKEKISKAISGENSPMYGMVGKKHPFFGKKHTDKSKEKIRIAALNREPTFKNTSIEIFLQKELDKLEITYQTHIPVCKVCQPDIVFPDRKIAIFCDGDYWHNLPNYIKRDKLQNKILEENGWVIRRFWGHEIREDLNRCIDEILYVLN